MSCQEFLKFLSSGAPLTPAAVSHLASCGRCKALVERLEPQAKEPPPVARVATIQHMLLSSLVPVHPLPSDLTLAFTALLGAVILVFVCALPFGYLALRSLSARQMIEYYGLILVLGILLATATVQDMIPGAKRTVNRSLLIIGAFAALAAATLLLFPIFAGPRFVHFGIPCLRLGTASAAIAGIAAYLLLRRGVLTTPLQTCVLAGTFAGLTGFGVLALHCPIQQSGHILAWHLGAMAIAGCGGAVLGLSAEFFGRFGKFVA